MTRDAIGVVGVSPEGSALFCRQLSRHASALLDGSDHPEVVLHNFPFSRYMERIGRGDWQGVAALLRESAERVRAAGAGVVVCPDSAVQHVVPLAQDVSSPWVAMTEQVSQRVANDGRSTVGLVGTRLVTEGGVYQTHLGLLGVQLLTPSEEDIEALDRVIFRELVFGRARSSSLGLLLGVIDRLAMAGCEGVVIGSSEVPVLLSGHGCGLPVYDASDILAEAAVRQATGLDDADAGSGVDSGLGTGLSTASGWNADPGSGATDPGEDMASS